MGLLSWAHGGVSVGASAAAISIAKVLAAAWRPSGYSV